MIGMLPDVEGLFASDLRLGSGLQSLFVIGFKIGKQAVMMPRRVSREVRSAMIAYASCEDGLLGLSMVAVTWMR